jgi:hypothetical protein
LRTHQIIDLSHQKTTTYDVGNPGPGLGQTHKCGGVKPVNEWGSNPPKFQKLKVCSPLRTDKKGTLW